ILKLSRLELLIVFSLALMFVSLLIPMLGDWEAVVLAPDTLPRLPALVEAAARASSTKGNPLPLTADEMRDLVVAAL
ncbi:MAG TPA: hypothetical protein PKW45_08860, partial [Bryobacteraceae bacterium]|nr:hypothetical protein [Bryobacteraceae bacterium]